MAINKYPESRVVELESATFGVNSTVYHHVVRAREAASHVKVAIAADNTSLALLDIGRLIEEVDTLHKFLTDIGNVVTGDNSEQK